MLENVETRLYSDWQIQASWTQISTHGFMGSLHPPKAFISEYTAFWQNFLEPICRDTSRNWVLPSSILNPDLGSYWVWLSTVSFDDLALEVCPLPATSCGCVIFSQGNRQYNMDPQHGPTTWTRPSEYLLLEVYVLVNHTNHAGRCQCRCWWVRGTTTNHDLRLVICNN